MSKLGLTGIIFSTILYGCDSVGDIIINEIEIHSQVI